MKNRIVIVSDGIKKSEVLKIGCCTGAVIRVSMAD
jgi:hypothetical protein